MEKDQLRSIQKAQAITKPLCAPDVFKKTFYRAGQEFYAHRDSDFEVDMGNRNFLGHFCRYWNREADFETTANISLHKGLMVFGSHGTGKTSSFEIVQTMARKYEARELWFPSISAQEVVARYNVEKNKEDVISYYSQGVFLFDDLGAEMQGNNVHQFGKEEIFIRILLNRYRNFESKGTKTHLTTNLGPGQIEERYGRPVADRFIKMFNLLKLDGPSRRK